MNKSMHWLLLGTFLGAQAPPVLPDPVPAPRVGGYAPAPVDPQAVRWACRTVQEAFGGSRLLVTRVESVSTQVVAGVNTRLLCQARERRRDGRRETWRWAFVVTTALDGQRRLLSAERLGRLDRIAP